MNLKEALKQLDSDNDMHWTTEGKPRVDAVNAILNADDPLGDDLIEVKRADIVAEAPDFSREHAASESGDAEEDVAAVTEQSENRPPEEPEAETETEVEDFDLDLELPESLELPDVLPEHATDEQREEQRMLLRSSLDMIEMYASNVRDHIAKLQMKRDRLNAFAAVVTERLGEEVGPIPLSTALRHYTESQKKLRMARFGRVTRMEELTGEKVVMERAPIDRAFARKNLRGTRRPTRV